MSFGSTPLVSAKVNGATGGTTAAVDTTGAKLLVIEAAFSGSVAVSDSKGNTWVPGTLFNGTTPNTQFFYCISPTVGTGHTFTIAASVSSIVMSAWSCTGTPALDSQGTPNATTNVQGQFSGSSFTPVANGCLLLGGAAWASATSGFGGGSGWTLIDAQPYVGGTSYGTSCAYKIQSTATAVPTTEGTVTWSSGSTNVCYNGIAFSETVSATLTIQSPSAFEVHQRSGSTGSIQVAFTTTGATEDIEASFNGGAYQTIKTNHAAGAGVGTLTGQAQGQGTLTVRKKTTTSASATVANVKIGDVFLVGGDSLGEGRGTNAQAYTASGGNGASDFRQDNAWKDGNDPSDTGTSSGSHWPLLATLLLADAGVPVGFITTATGGTDCAGSVNSWAKPNGDYSAMQTTVTNSTAAGVKAALFQLGPNAVVNGNNAAIARSTYAAALGTLASNIAADVPGAPPTFVGLCGQVTTGSPPDRRTAEDNIRGAVKDAVAANNIKMGPNLVGQAYSDGVHPQTDALLLEVAQRWYLCLKEAFYGGAAGSSRGPRLSSAAWNVARTQLTVTFDRALKTGLTFSTAPWKVSDNGSAMTVSGVAYHGTNPNAVVITTSAAATGPANTTTLTFASGEDATGVVIPKSTDITLPVGGPIQIPAEPIYAQSVAEAGSLATAVPYTLTTNGTTPAASLSGLKYAVCSQATPDLWTAPIKKGANATTDGSGAGSIDITGLGLFVGAVVSLVITDSDGDPLHVGGHKAMYAPITVT